MATHTLTRDGYERLAAELRRLQEQELPSLRERMADINEEFTDPDIQIRHDTMRDLVVTEERVAALQRVLADADVLDEDADPERSSPGDIIVVQDVTTGEELTFHLRDGAEVQHGTVSDVDDDALVVSTSAPVGQALLGTRVGDVVRVDVPDGVAHYKVLRFAHDR